MQNISILTEACTPCRTPPKQPTSDEALIASIADGDANAMRMLYGRHSLRVYRFVVRRTGDHTQAEDIVNEVFLDIWRHAHRFEGRSKVATWLLAIARHKALDGLRRTRELPIDGETAQALADPADDPEVIVHKQGRREIVRRCLRKLSPAHREVIDLAYYHRLSVSEVAEVVRAPIATVKTRMFYARKHMGELLRAAGVDGV